MLSSCTYDLRGAALASVVASLALVLGAIYAFDHWPVGHAGDIYIALHLAMTAAMLIAWTSPKVGTRELLILAVVLRLSLIPAAPISSNDVERYLWDGAVALSGLDPYTVAPDNPLAAELRAVWPTPEEHAKHPTLYPPAALMMFALSALAGPVGGIFVWKAIAAATGIASVMVMKAVLEHYEQERHFALVALGPLLVLETGVGAHLDSLLVLGIALILYCHTKGYWGALGVALGWSACAKFLPIALLAPLFFMVPLRNYLITLSTCVATAIGFYGAALALGYTPIGILPIFFEKWRFTSPLHQLLEVGFGPSAVMLPIIALALSGVLVSCIIARRNAMLGFTVILSVPLLLSPVVFPWYLMPLVPLLAVRFNVTVLLWVSAVPLSYIVLNRWLGERIWEPALWPAFAIGLALAAGLSCDLLRQKFQHQSVTFKPTAS